MWSTKNGEPSIGYLGYLSNGGASKGCCRVAEEGGPVRACSIGVEMYCCR